MSKKGYVGLVIDIEYNNSVGEIVDEKVFKKREHLEEAIKKMQDNDCKRGWDFKYEVWQVVVE